MSLYCAMIPDDVGSTDPVFTRYGRLSKCLETAKRIASKRCGRVLEVDGNTTKRVADFWVYPEPIAKRTASEYRQARANAALFGVTL